MWRFITKPVKKLPYLRHVFLERDQLRALKAEGKLLAYPPEHFHSPIPCLEEIRRKEAEIFDRAPRVVPAIDLNEEKQLALFQNFKRYYRELPFQADKQTELLYYLKNGYYPYADGIILYCMVREVAPKRVIEVGSGYSSCVILDTSHLFFADAISCTFVEPNPSRLLSLLTESDKARHRILQANLQDVDPRIFAGLSEGDILLVDSSHVCKTSSDVNYIFFEVLPKLKKGVYVHFHDVVYPFEYPKEFVYMGRAWNEAYVLRAFLQYNHAFEIQFFSSFFERFHQDKLAEHMPLYMKSKGMSIWIKKVSDT
jgi:hypothetical protein